ncbi:hypothetical protein F4818DRAFT_457269 [Hypoxylon cercidicola]|nr:hypothetical protein F4818DRAFT_457269 [Hypoxylon cercidicola]
MAPEHQQNQEHNIDLPHDNLISVFYETIFLFRSLITATSFCVFQLGKLYFDTGINVFKIWCKILLILYIEVSVAVELTATTIFLLCLHHLDMLEPLQAPREESPRDPRQDHRQERQPEEHRREEAKSITFATPPTRLPRPRATRQASDLREEMMSEKSNRHGIPVSRSAAGLGRARRSGDLPPSSQRSGTPQSIQTIYENQPSEASSSRKLSAGFTPGGPLSSHPTTAYSSVTASIDRQTAVQTSRQRPDNASNQDDPFASAPATATSSIAASSSQGALHRLAPGALRPSKTMSNIPTPSGSPKRDNLGVPRSTLPVPKFALTPSTSAAALSQFKEENIPPSSSVSGIARARDSMLLPKNLAKKQRPEEAQGIDNPVAEAAPATKHAQQTQQTLAPIKETQPKNAFEEFPAPTSKLPQQQKQTRVVQQQEDEHELADLPASASASKLPASKLPTPASKGKDKDVLTDLPTSKLPKLKASSSSPKKASGLPRSRTLGLFSNLAASFSHTSLGSFGRNASRKPSKSSMADSYSNSASKRSGSALGNGSSGVPSTRNATPVEGPPASASASTAGPDDEDDENDKNNKKKPPHRNQRLVYEAHDFTFWTGRFVALQDRFKNEMLERKNLQTIVTAHAQQSLVPRPSAGSSKPRAEAGLPTSHTTANLMRAGPQQQQQQQQDGTQATGAGADANTPPQSPQSVLNAAVLLLDDEARLRRTWMHMEAMCANNDALRSMHRFQQAYARQFNLPKCLPKGGTMSDDDPKARLFHVYPSYGDSQQGARSSSSGSKVGGKKEGKKAAKGGGGGGGQDGADDTESKDGKGKGKGWVGRMFSGGKKGGSTSPK